jgi:hypothetical protein
MKTYDFIASLVGSLAWPAAVVVIAFMFRRSIRQLLRGHLSRLKAGPFEADFDLIASQVQAQVDQPTIVQGKPTAGKSRMIGELRERTAKSPEAAVIEGYGEVERELATVIAQAGESQNGDMPRSAAGLARLAASKGIIRPETVNAVEGLTVLRNLAAHRGDVTEEKAEEYLTLVEAVIFAIRQNARDSQKHPVIAG